MRGTHVGAMQVLVLPGALSNHTLRGEFYAEFDTVNRR